MRSPSLLLILATASACAPHTLQAVAVPCAVAPPVVAPATPVAAPAVSRPSIYLAPSSAGGSPFCFDPASTALRQAVARPAPKPDDPIDAPLLADDVRDFHKAMGKLYAGYPELLQKTTFDVDAFFADWEREVRAAGATIPFRDGVVNRLVALRRQVQDNHLTARGSGNLATRPELAFAEYQAAGRFNGLDEARCTFASATPVHGSVRVVSMLTRAGKKEVSTFSAQSVAPVVDVRCGDETRPFQRRAAHDVRSDAKAPVYEWKTVGNATVITVRRLYGSPADKALLARIPADSAEHAKKPVVVFDFRGNGGGSDQYVFDWVGKLAKGTWPAAYADLRATGAATACGDWNELVYEQIEYERIDTPEAVGERAAFQRDTPLGGRASDPVQQLDRAPNSANPKHPYTGRVFVLVDHASSSSGESAPEELRLAMHATIVGERSGGYAEFGNIRPYLMPRTGLQWNLASKRNYFESPRDGVGFPVDVALDSELLGAPVEELLPLLEALPK